MLLIVPILCHVFLILLRIHKICCLENLSKLNILDLHDNQVQFLYCHPAYRICVLNHVNLLATAVNVIAQWELTNSVLGAVKSVCF